MTDVADGNLGAEAVYKLTLNEGKLKLSLDYDGKQADAGLYISLDVKQFIELLKDAIPGKIDDIILDGLLAALK